MSTGHQGLALTFGSRTLVTHLVEMHVASPSVCQSILTDSQTILYNFGWEEVWRCALIRPHALHRGVRIHFDASDNKYGEVHLECIAFKETLFVDIKATYWPKNGGRSLGEVPASGARCTLPTR